MKKYIDRDEWWPVYDLSNSYGRLCDVPDELIARYEKADKEFMAVQKELCKLYQAPRPDEAGE